MKNPLTSAAIEPAYFRFVAQHLNHCATAVPMSEWVSELINSYYLNFPVISVRFHCEGTYVAWHPLELRTNNINILGNALTETATYCGLEQKF